MPDSSGATVLDDLPEPIVVLEILVRLPPKDALRCRAVCKSWRKSTATGDFLLAHHRHQPSLPVIKLSPDIEHFTDVLPFDDPRLVVFHDTGASNQNLWPVLRYATPRRDFAMLHLHASRDGLLLVSIRIGLSGREQVFYVCNPATRQCAPVPQLYEPSHGQQVLTTSIAGLYLHHPSREYRVLYFCWVLPANRKVPKAADFYITVVGSDEPRRFIGRPPVSSPPSVEQALLNGLPCCDQIAPVLHRGGLHWDLGRYHRCYTVVHDIMVFDTAVETFRWLRRPAQASLGLWTSLLEMDGALALFSARDGVVVDVFVMQDYDSMRKRFGSHGTGLTCRRPWRNCRSFS